jgi:hypothetical protein
MQPSAVGRFHDWHRHLNRSSRERRVEIHYIGHRKDIYELFTEELRRRP